MKKLHSILALLLALALAFSLAACGGEESKPADDENNTAPSITGVADGSVEAGHEFDALAGVTATDAEDGDLTAQIVIDSSPALDFQNGKATPPTAGDYELTYTVTDKGGKTATAYATLTVTRATGEPVVYKAFDFSLHAEPESFGWEARVSENAEAEGTFKQGACVFDIVNPGEGDGDVQLVRAGYALEKADYRVKIWAKSTKDTYAHLLIEDAGTDDWRTIGEAWNQKITPVMTPIEVNFSAAEDMTVDVRLHLGKITPNGENPADTTPEDFAVTIDKVEIY